MHGRLAGGRRGADRRRRRGGAGRPAEGGHRGPAVPRPTRGSSPSQRVTAALTGLGNVGIDTHEPLIRSLARLDAPGADFTATATLAVTGGITVDLDTRGTIDVAAERARLEKDRAAAEKEAAQCRAKLGNEAFIGKAPEQVVAKIKDRLATAEADLDADRRGPDRVAAAS